MNLINQEKKQEMTGIMTAKREREPYQFARNELADQLANQGVEAFLSNN